MTTRLLLAMLVPLFLLAACAEFPESTTKPASATQPAPNQPAPPPRPMSPY